MTPGTHFVARAGDYVIKIYAPKESGIASDERQAEAIGLRHARAQGLLVPELIATGQLQDKYLFGYMIQRFLPGPDFALAGQRLGVDERLALGQRLRQMTDRLNLPLADMPPLALAARARDNQRWQGWPDSFNRERLAWLAAWRPHDLVFVHGDINEDNLMLTDQGPALIDFGDCCLAPRCYEDVVVAIELFRLEADYLRGYFGDTDRQSLLNSLVEGLLLHDFGADIARLRLGLHTSISLSALRQGIARQLPAF